MTSTTSPTAIEYLPELTRSPTKLAIVYVGDCVPEIEDEVLRRIQSHDVVLVARGRELASYMAERLKDQKHGRWVVDYVDSAARERYLTWLGELGARHPRAEALWVVMGISPLRGPQCGEPFFMLDEIALAELLDLAPRVFKKDARGLPFEYDGRPAELWLKIPLDDVPEWASRALDKTLDGRRLEASAQYGTVRVRLAGPDVRREFAYFRVDRREKDERVAVVYTFQGGELGHAIEDDVFESIRVLPASSTVILTEAPYSDSSKDIFATSMADLLSVWEAAPAESVEAAERLEPDPQPRSDDPLIQRAINEDFNT